MFDLSGHRALVTGAGQGVGAGIAQALAARGAHVAVNDLVQERADETAARIARGGGRAIAVAFDVTDIDAAATGIQRAADELGGPVDVLVNNAGVPSDMTLTPFVDMDPATWRRYVDLNLYGSLHCIRPALPAMRASGWGRVVQISSGAARSGTNMGISLYGASKAAIEGFLRHLAQEVATDGVTVNAVALGLMDNAVGEGSEAPTILEHLARTVPVGRLGTPQDAAAAVVYLASEEASWLTGQVIQLNGGQITT